MLTSDPQPSCESSSAMPMFGSVGQAPEYVIDVSPTGRTGSLFQVRGTDKHAGPESAPERPGRNLPRQAILA